MAKKLASNKAEGADETARPTVPSARPRPPGSALDGGSGAGLGPGRPSLGVLSPRGAGGQSLRPRCRP